MDEISKFVEKLARRPETDTVFNPYRDARLAKNLELYLQLMKSQQWTRVLLVGEAPGFAGCKLTGIPFSSGYAIKNIEHPLLVALRKDIHLDSEVSEATAKIVWEYLIDKAQTPLFWNSFPFHPHPKGAKEKNRAPSAAEVEEGVDYLQDIVAIFKPDQVLGLGRKGEACAGKALPDREIGYIRHPSRGGKSKFIEGLTRVLD